MAYNKLVFGPVRKDVDIRIIMQYVVSVSVPSEKLTDPKKSLVLKT
jgi:hypothetical protein